MPIIEYRPQSKVKEISNWLLASGRSVTSQLGQDGILEKIFEIIGTTNKVCIEFGAWDGKFLSNTWNLIENKGWHGVLIEGNSAKFSEISGNHPSGRVTAYNTRVNLSGANSIDNILQTYGELAPDLMSIDIDGNDWHVWSSMDLLKPRVVLIEFNQTIPNDVYFVQDPEFTINQGASLLALIELGRRKGYQLVCVEQWDGFFVRDELFGSFGIEDNSIDAMFHSPSQTKIFQCFDGKLYTTGNRTLLWSGKTFSEDQLQVLSPSEQGFEDHLSEGAAAARQARISFRWSNPSRRAAARKGEAFAC